MAGKKNKKQKPKVQGTKKVTTQKSKKTQQFWTRKKVLAVVGSIVSIGALIAASIGISNLVTATRQRKCEHEYVFVEKLVAEGCETEGLHLYKCELCDKETKEVALALGHAKKSVEMISPTCKESGWSDYEVCETCNQEWGKVELSALGHNPVTDMSKPATCDETGLTEGSHCGRCGDIIVEQKVVPKLKHNPIQVIGKPATCEESGLTNGSKCEYCEKVFVAQEEILPLQHSLEYYTRKEVTCMESGHEAYEECKRDGCDYTTYVEIPLLGHDLENGICSRCEYVLPENHVHEYTKVTVLKKATCTEAGNARYTCECGDTYTEELEATGHAYDNGQVSKKATCTAVGEMVYTCSACATQKTEEIEATGHSYDVETVEPTCEKDGYIRSSCGACGDIKQETLTKLGHDYDEGETTIEPTCLDYGAKTYTCARCENVHDEQLLALGHTYIDGVCNGCGQTIIHEGLSMAVYNDIDVTQYRPLVYYQGKVEASLTGEILRDARNEFGLILVNAEAINQVNGDQHTDWITAFDLLGVSYEYETATLQENVTGSYYTSIVVSKFIQYEELNTEFLAIPCIKTVSGGVTTYQYAEVVTNNQYTTYTNYTFLPAKILYEGLTNYTYNVHYKVSHPYTNAQLANVKQWLNEAIDLANGLAATDSVDSINDVFSLECPGVVSFTAAGESQTLQLKLKNAAFASKLGINAGDVIIATERVEGVAASVNKVVSDNGTFTITAKASSASVSTTKVYVYCGAQVYTITVTVPMQA